MQLGTSDFADFDIVILGFGFPSYSPTRRVLYEARRVIAADGWLLASIYNHSALAYERWTEGENDLQRPISTWINRDAGIIEIPTGPTTVERITARTFTPGHFQRELRQAGFHVGGFLTFPVLYSTLKSTEIESFAQIEKAAHKKYSRDHYGNDKFSHELWRVDKQVSASLKDRGFYGAFLASLSRSDVMEVSTHLGLHPANTLSP